MEDAKDVKAARTRTIDQYRGMDSELEAWLDVDGVTFWVCKLGYGMFLAGR